MDDLAILDGTYFKNLPLTGPSNQIPPLKTLTLKSRPLATHAIAFSCDAELAVAADDSVHVFLPEYPTPEDPSTQKPAAAPPEAVDDNPQNDALPAAAAAAAAAASQDAENKSRQQYYTYILRIPLSRKPDPRMNAALFAAQSLAPPAYEDDYANPGDVDPASVFEGVGSGTVTGYGASLNQLVALEWSPAGVGRNLRPVLAVMLTNGALLVLGEGGGAGAGGGGGGGGNIDLGARMRNFRDWRILWGAGANLPLPDAGSEDGAYLPKDKIRSFAWARRVDTGRALLAYATDQEEVVVLSVQYYLPNENDDGSDAGAYVWEVEEVARFDGRGPHPTPSITDPDYTPYSSAFSLKWSPWLLSDDARTAVISYCARNYVGFRRITIPRAWARGAGVEVSVEEADVTGICTHLAPDAFVEWEDAVWDHDGAKVCRGVIASPFKAQPFQVALNGPEGAVEEGHKTEVCGTTYPEDTTSLDATNPISSLIIHPPDMTKRTKAPSYSLVRLSATGSNDNWFQQNAIDTFSDTVLPKWAETISSTVKLSVPAAMLGRGSGGAPGGDAESAASDDDDSDDEDFDLPEDAGEQIRPYRVRVWGLTVSPAGGVTAVLVSQHSTQQPEKSVKTRVMFGGKVSSSGGGGGEMMDLDGTGEGRPRPFWERQSTEAKMWDWMYGGGPAVPGTLATETAGVVEDVDGDVSLKARLREVKEKQRCVFCQTSLKQMGKESVCEGGHIFATCAATGLAILAPGISRACAVCGLRCLVAKEVVKIAQEHLGPDVRVETSEEVCGGCGGKFVV
ncbi:hypothetical protein CGCSCA4_v006059 [Colletotrichum siamense]|uniref:Gpi-anchor transamidase-like protein n=1 Tax=Colletotrichum siamense TaxID=690259 RepID=A0A9P5BT78_COLSI|nr:hypothetical protein CGCSCA4_v006059 [Colletotrichum siamense]KAF4851543.1 hypothetical protein CGCSCA2_v010753 [Colletotrichum siamense]